MVDKEINELTNNQHQNINEMADTFTHSQNFQKK